VGSVSRMRKLLSCFSNHYGSIIPPAPVVNPGECGAGANLELMGKRRTADRLSRFGPRKRQCASGKL
jgi:hypothetical protein